MKFTQKLQVGILFFFACGVIVGSLYAVSPEGETYYTKANIWYEDTTKPIIINYHKGTIIPVGTKVKIDAFAKNEIKFTTELGVTLVFLNASKYSTIKLQELFDRYFSKENVLAGWGGLYTKFSGKEKEDIKKGIIAEGMSKEAVLMAYGYPPSHRTAALTNDEWAYWNSRFVSFRVIFKNNRVNSIERGVRRTEEEGAKTK